MKATRRTNMIQMLMTYMYTTRLAALDRFDAYDRTHRPFPYRPGILPSTGGGCKDGERVKRRPRLRQIHCLCIPCQTQPFPILTISLCPISMVLSRSRRCHRRPARKHTDVGDAADMTRAKRMRSLVARRPAAAWPRPRPQTPHRC